MRSISFTVPGTPQGKGRPRASVIAGRARMHTPAQTRSYEAMVQHHAHEAMRASGLDALQGPLQLDLIMVYAVPASWPKRRQSQAYTGQVVPTTKPDADNCLKAVADACEGVVYADDRFIAAMHAAKRYGDMPRIEVRIAELQEAPR